MTTTGETKANVFISYSRKDIAFVDRLAMALEVQGVAPAIDRTEIYAFEDWWRRIQALVSAADTIIFVLSPDAIASEICHKEAAFALLQKKRIAPIVCRPVESDSVPADLAKLNFIFFDEPEKFDTALAQLVEALSIDISWVRQHTAFGLNADAWERAGRPDGLLLHSPRLEEAEHWIAGRPPNAPLPTDLTSAFIRESRRAATRRRNFLTGSLASGLVIALVLAGTAFWQRGIAIQNAEIAEAQRNRAEKTLAAATAAANTLVSDLALKLRNVTGVPVSLVKTILDRAIKLQDDLTSAGETSRGLRNSQAFALDEASHTLVTLGETQEALEASQKSVAISRDLAKDKGDANGQYNLSVGLLRSGDVKLEAGDGAGALAAFQESLVILRDLVKSNAGHPVNLAAALSGVGDARSQVGDGAGALAAYEESLAIRRDLAKDKSDASAQRNLAAIFARIGDAKVQAGDGPGALAAYEESLPIYRELAKDKSNAGDLRGLSLGLVRIGEIKQRAGDAAGGRAAYEESLAIARDLAKDKSNATAQSDLTAVIQRIGNLKMFANDEAGALALFEENLVISRELAKDKTNFRVQHGLATDLIKIGGMKMVKGDSPGALAALGESLAILRDLAKDKSNAEGQYTLAGDIGLIGDTKSQAGDAAGALAAYEESLAIARDIAKNTSSAKAQDLVGHNLVRLGDVKLQAGDGAGALVLYEDGLAIAHEFAEDKSNADAQKQLAVSDQKVADALKNLGKFEDALTYDEASLAIIEGLPQLKGSGESPPSDLWNALNRTGTDFLKLERPDEAFVDFDRLLTNVRQFAASYPNGSASHENIERAATTMGMLSFWLLFDKKFEKSLEASDRAIAAAPNLVSLYANRAHALMFLGRVEEARRLYRIHRGEKTGNNKIWEDDIRENFAALRKAGLTHPLMGEIERTFAKKHVGRNVRT